MGTIVSVIREQGPTGATGACCAADDTCIVTTETICAGSGYFYQGDGTNCDTPCNICDRVPIKITFSGVDFPGCCRSGGVGSGFSAKTLPCSTPGSGGCEDINRSEGWALDTFSFGFYSSSETSGNTVTETFLYLDEICDTFDTSGGDVWGILVGCDAIGFPDGWIVTVGDNVFFAATGIADPTIPFDNLDECGVPNPIDSFLLAVGENGTAVIEFM